MKLRVGAKMSPANVMAVTHLVSSAVEGLNPSAVSVLDMRGNLLSRNRPRGEADASAENEAAIEYQQKLEKELVTKVNATLEPLLGAERFRAAASVDCDLTSGEQSEETFDPTKSVMTSQQRTEDGAMASYAGGVPGTASNLPRPTPKSAGGEGGGVSRRTEQISYQTSRLMRRIKLPQGTVKRLSVAVLLDQDVKWDGVGPTAKRSLIPVPPEKLKSIHDLVAAAIGLSAQRGDQLTVDSLPFESTLNSEPPAAPVVAKPQRPMVQRIKEKDPEALQIVGGIAGGVLLLVIIAGMKLKGSKKKGTKASKKGEIEVKELPAAVHAAEAHLDPTKAVAAAEGAEGPTFAEALSAPQPEPNTYLEALTQAETNQKKQLGPTRMDTITTDLRESATKDSELYASIMRGWLAEDQ